MSSPTYQQLIATRDGRKRTAEAALATAENQARTLVENAHAHLRSETEAADAAFDGELDSRDAARAIAVAAALAPLAATFAEEPRSATPGIAAAFKSHSEASTTEIGEPLSPFWLAMAFVKTHALEGSFGEYSSWFITHSPFTMTAESAAGLCMSSAPVALIQRALEDLEIEVLKVGRMRAGYPNEGAIAAVSAVAGRARFNRVAQAGVDRARRGELGLPAA